MRIAQFPSSSLFTRNEISAIDSHDFYVPLLRRDAYIYIYSQHLALDPRFDKVAIAKSALRRGRLIFVQAGMACDHLAKLAGSGWRDQTGNPTERMDEYE